MNGFAIGTAARNAGEAEEDIGAEEDIMTLKFAGLVAGLLAIGFMATDAGAQSPPTTPKRQRVTADGPNYSYMSGPHTRVYITKRSWLDAGTEVLPDERKFTDYATGGPNQFEYLDRLNSHMDRRRSPLSTPADLGGSPTGFPLPPY